MIKYNAYNVPILTKKEEKALYKYLLSFPCTACKAQSGIKCKGSSYVHIGRLPEGFDTEKWLIQHRSNVNG